MTRFIIVFRLISCAVVLLSMSCQSIADESADKGDDSANVLVVCPQPFADALSPWIERRASDGLTVRVIAPQSNVSTQQKKIREASDDNTKYLVLVGDAPVIGTFCDVKSEIPTHYKKTTVTAKWGSTKSLPTDFPYGDVDDDGSADLAVGRIPISKPAELTDYIKRVAAYEESQNFGQWRNQVQLVGGVGGFGALADSAIESVTRSVITTVLPRATQTTVAYASQGHPFCPTGKSFTDCVIDRYDSGCRFWVYAGHGQVTELDRFPQTRAGRPVLDRNSIARLNAKADSSPIALLLCCFTGAYDASEDCFSERLLLHSGGPIAVLSGSRVTMPYGNATAAVGLIDGVYEQKLERLGDAWLVALNQMTAPDDQKKSSIRMMIDSMALMVSPAGTKLTDERSEHTQLYNLLGDPTLRMQPSGDIELKAATGYDKGKPIDVLVNSSLSGTLTLSAHYPLGSKSDGDPNETQWATTSSEVVADVPLTLSLSIPKSIRGLVILRAHVSAKGSWAVGATQTNIRP